MLIDTTLHSRCDEASALQQQLELVSELESDLQDIVYLGKKLLVDYNVVNLIDRSNNWSGAIAVKMNGSVLEEKSSCKILGLSLSAKLEHLGLLHFLYY